MTGAEMKQAMQNGTFRFQHVKTGREFDLDPEQWRLLTCDDADQVLLVGFPTKKNPRQRGRRWQWLAPKNLKISTQI